MDGQGHSEGLAHGVSRKVTNGSANLCLCPKDLWKAERGSDELEIELRRFLRSVEEQAVTSGCLEREPRRDQLGKVEEEWLNTTEPEPEDWGTTSAHPRCKK